MTRSTFFANEEFYHIYNRGVDKRCIFIDDQDRTRFLRSMHLFREKDVVRNNSISRYSASKHIITPYVNIHHFVLMQNHFHFLLEQTNDDGVSKFMQRLGNGYTLYFNKRHDRSGSLFQSTYQAQHIDSDEYFLQLVRYMCLNPMKLLYPNMQLRRHTDISKAFKRLRTYPWSSYGLYLTDDECEHITKGKTMSFFNNQDNFRHFVENIN